MPSECGKYCVLLTRLNISRNAQLLISEFWRKQGKDNKGKPKSSKARARKSETRDDTSSAGATNKRRKSSSTRRKSKSSQPDGDDNDGDGDGDGDDEEEEMPKAKKLRRVSRVKTSEDRMDLDGEDDADSQYRPMQKYKEKKSWESLVKKVDTIEKVEGNLKVFFTLYVLRSLRSPLVELCLATGTTATKSWNLHKNVLDISHKR